MIGHAEPKTPEDVRALAAAVAQRMRARDLARRAALLREARAEAAEQAERLAAQEAAAEARRLREARTRSAAEAERLAGMARAKAEQIAGARAEAEARTRALSAERRAKMEAALAAYAREPDLAAPPPPEMPARGLWVMGQARAACGVPPQDMYLRCGSPRLARVLAVMALRHDGASRQATAAATGQGCDAAGSCRRDGARMLRMRPDFRARLDRLTAALDAAPGVCSIRDERLIAVAARCGGVSRGALLGESRRAEVVAARAAAAWAGRRVLGLSLLQLGVALQRHHTSVMNLLRKAGAGHWAGACAEAEAELRRVLAEGEA